MGRLLTGLGQDIVSAACKLIKDDNADQYFHLVILREISKPGRDLEAARASEFYSD